ncbi:MAG: response regulator [Anaerolineales bacterium]|nr:response regulator [Anaerolineales bacterium]MCA9929064.1 response regulator [Anaerolineales bacterium]
MTLKSISDFTARPSALDTLHNGNPAHLLIVDDEPEIAESLADYLTKKEGFRISLADNGQKALDILQSTVGVEDEIDLVLLDMRMPRMSGLDVLNWIRKHPELQYTRVVLLTAAAGSHEKVEALSAGADDYITKPYSPQELLARVKTILRTLALEKQLQRQSQQLATLNRIGQQVAAKLEAAEVLETAVSGIGSLLDTTIAAALQLEGGSLRYKAVHFANGNPHPDKLPIVLPGQGILGTVLTEQKGHFINYIEANGRFLPATDAPNDQEIYNMIVVPLVVRSRPVGVLSAYNKPGTGFNDVDLDLFASLASSISEAIENSWLFQRIRLRQQELLENRNTLQALINGIPHPIYTINKNWELVTVNQSKADELETTPDTLVGPVCYRAFFNRETPCDHCGVALTLEKRQEKVWTHSWIGPDHLLREWDVSAYPIPSKQADSARAVILWQDRTEERRLETSLLQAGKLAAIGQLAAGVAHEINNPLTAVNANAEILKMVIPLEDENYESVDLIHRAGVQAAKVVRGLLDFARQEQYSFAPADINNSIQQALDLVQYQLYQANTKIMLNMDYNLPLIVASWEHMKSVWLNLIVNARDAVEYQEENREVEITTRMSPDRDHIQVLIRDNGKGMSKAEQVHIFEPFYTTKDPGKGTGLGLATCHRIVEQHNGEINVVSAPGEGTTFIIRLPVDHSS